MTGNREHFLIVQDFLFLENAMKTFTLADYKEKAAIGKAAALRTIQQCDDLIAGGFGDAAELTEMKNIAQLRFKRIEEIEARIEAMCN